MGTKKVNERLELAKKLVHTALKAWLLKCPKDTEVKRDTPEHLETATFHATLHAVAEELQGEVEWTTLFPFVAVVDGEHYLIELDDDNHKITAMWCEGGLVVL